MGSHRVTTKLHDELVYKAIGESTFEFKLVDPMAFGLTTASPLQRAVCRIVDGQPLHELAYDRTVMKAMGTLNPNDVLERPREVYLMSGIRTGKSLTAACGAFHMAMTCNVSQLREGEIPRVSVVSLKKDLADVIMNHLVGTLKSSPLLSKFMVGQPQAESVMLRHPSGRHVEVSVVAGSRAGSSLVARWSAGAIFDEAPRMVSGNDGVVNFDDMRQAVLLRLLEGSQLWAVGSPWAPYGPIYETVTRFFGKPSRERVVVKAPAYDFNPVYWTPERVQQARDADPDAARTDVDAEFATPEEAMFSAVSVDACTRADELVLPRKPGNTYFAAMDPATRGNGWTFAIGTRDGGKAVIVRAEEFVGAREEPLDPADVLEQVAALCAEYGVTMVHSDQVMGDALVKLGRQKGIHIAQWRYQERQRAEMFLTIRQRLDLVEVSLPPVPQMRTDLLHVKKRITATGMGVALPLTSDGRHCDWAPTLMLLLPRIMPDPVEQAPSDGRPPADPETLRLRRELQERMRKKANGSSW